MKNDRPLLIGTNLKMYKTAAETVRYLSGLIDRSSELPLEELRLFVIPSFTSLYPAREILRDSPIMLGAQNMFWEDEGQYTGEVSPPMLKELGVRIAEIGHSERREHFGETDRDVNRKAAAAIRHGLIALVCMGETKTDKELDIVEERLSEQIKVGLKPLGGQAPGSLWIAYEPAWAIGRGGIPAEPGYVAARHRFIRSVLVRVFDEEGRKIPILYGGSVNEENACAYISQPEVDGLFVGRAAWQAEGFARLIRRVMPVWHAKHSRGVSHD